MALPLIFAVIAVAAVIACLRAAAHVIAAVTAACRKFRPLMLFLAGAPMDGRHHTDATFLRGPTKILHPRGRLSPHWWHWRAGWHRGAIRVLAVLASCAVVLGLVVATLVTLAVLLAIALAAFGCAAWRVWLAARGWRHHHMWVRPVHRSLAAELGAPPPRLAIERDRSKVVIGLPEEFSSSDRDRDAITRIVTTRLALEAPDADWSKLTGAKPQVTFTRSQPPPSKVTWRDIEGAVTGAASHELITGLGKKSAIVPVSVDSDSPHFLLAMGSGGGKSNTAAFWMIQRLMRGDIVLILDAKYISHPWTFKDMDAGYGQLPNVAYARTTEALHSAMVWLGVELQRRTEAAERHVNARGDILGDVGPRLWIVAEEMNLATPRLKQFWAEIRHKEDPKRSPALDGMAAVAFAGRAVKMHLIVIGQMLTAASMGGGDVRENMGVRVLARYTANSWKMQAGDLPMPPSPDTPGRVQVVTGGTVREAQVPLMDLGQCRELALAGSVTPCPPDMPGIAPGPAVPAIEQANNGSDQGVVLGRARPPGVMTLREAADGGLFPSLAAARKTVQRRELEPAGRDGSSHLYFISELAGTVKGQQ
jgi:hypothetical protein